MESVDKFENQGKQDHERDDRTRFPLLLCESPAEALDILAKQRKQVWTADMEGTPCYDAELAQNVAIVIGNEGKGVGRLVKEKCDFVLSIPMYGSINSLNASNAAAVLMYGIRRARTEAAK